MEAPAARLVPGAPEVVFGFGVHSAVADSPDLLRIVQQADRDGLDVFSLSDHPYVGDRLDAYATLGFVLGRTARLGGFVNVTNAARQPALLARELGTLSLLSGGRLVLGLGAGGLWDRIADLGVPKRSPKEAVEAFAETIELVRTLSGGGPPVSFEGRHLHVHEIEPMPVPAPAIWTGSVGPRSLEVTGRLADGWIPGHAADWRSERYRTSRPIVDEAAAAAGRDPSEVRTVYNLAGRITEQPLAATRGEDGRWIGGSPAQWVEGLTEAVVEHDAGGFLLHAPDGGDIEATHVARWANEVAPAVREAIAGRPRAGRPG